MASNLPLIVLLLLVSLSLASVYVEAKSHDQRSSMTVVEDLVETRSLRSLLSEPKLVAVIKKGSSGFRRSSKSAKKIGALDAAIVGYIIGAIVGVIVILAVIYCLLRVYIKHQDKNAQNIEQDKPTEETYGSSETQTYKTKEINEPIEVHTFKTEETQTSKTEGINESSKIQTSKIEKVIGSLETHTYKTEDV